MTISYKELKSRFVHGKVTDKDIIRAVDYNRCLGNIDIAINCMELARADERAKMTQEKFAEYFNTLQGGEVASAILTQLLRRGITDDDLKGLRLQWIKEQQEGVEVWVSWDGNNNMVAPELWIMRPRPNMNGTFTGKVHHDAISSELNISPGECAKFRIVRVGE